MLRKTGADRDVVLPMRRQTIGVQIRAILRREIIKGQLLPRSLLSEQDLSQRFGSGGGLKSGSGRAPPAFVRVVGMRRW